MALAWLIDDEAPNAWLKWAGLGFGGYKWAQFKYLTILVLGTALAWTCRQHGSSFIQFSSCDGAPDELVCFRKEAVLRMSFTTFLFFALHPFAILGIAAIKGPDQDEVEQAVCNLHAGVQVLQ